MPKNIVVCSDGTGNSAIKGRGTNVFKMFECVDLNGHRFDPQCTPQVAIYDDGVGTEEFKLAKILGGAAGYGLSRNVRQLYKELCRVYDPGDRIFLFGFSRGAFTIRTLAGFICRLGILKVQGAATSDLLERKVQDAYKVYRSGYRTALRQLFMGKPDTSRMERYRQEHAHGGEKIAFIGVWDTVDAVGLPLHIADVINKTLYQFKFPNLTLSQHVERACHALAIDDERHSFHPLLWDQTGMDDDKRIEQVWFCGAHSNVGGGYPKQGMSLVALDWMMAKAQAEGLRFVQTERDYYGEHCNVDDKLYNSRAGIGTFYRWLPRHISRICEKSGIRPTLHLSVLERIAHGTDDYGPGNLPFGANVVITPTGDAARDRAAQARAEETRKVLANAGTAGDSLLDVVWNAVTVGRWSYRLFMLTALAFLLVAAAPSGASPLSWAAIKGVPSLIGGLTTSPFSKGWDVIQQLFDRPLALGIVAGGLLVSFLLASYSDRRIASVYSQFWFGKQQELRQALKRARQSAQAAGNAEASSAKAA